MPKVRFIAQNRLIEVPEGTNLMQAARLAGVALETPCNGAGTCGKCLMKVSNPSGLKQLEAVRTLTKQQQAEGYVLACHSLVQGDIDVLFVAAGRPNEPQMILREGLETEVAVRPAIRKEYREGRTVVYGEDGVLGQEEGDTTARMYGVTVDIGTTTVVAALIDCRNGQEMDSRSALNPQCRYAQDVVSRIQFCAQQEDGLSILYQAITDTCNALIGELCAQNGVPAEYIYEVVYSGNTTMLHLAANTDPQSLGQYPYTPKLTGAVCLPSTELGLEISPFGRVYLPPVISAYVGADITSGILSCDLEHQEGNTLFIDIGTNGEMVFASGGAMSATSTAAGPAFEGMNITFGMRAGRGAIESVEIDEDGTVHIGTIGGTEPEGICGSGLFDAVGELARIGVIERSGRLVKANKCPLPERITNRLEQYNGKPAFRLADGVYLTQLDIRQIQMAKSAIRAGIEAMMQIHHCEAAAVDRVYIAGAFGYHLRVSSLVNIGIIPECLRDKVQFAGNTSKTGGTAFLLNTDCRNKMQALVSGIAPLDLSDYPGFQDLFVQYMQF